jgi:16S rRNA C967 or C1407 C5-methylase (RsmB/RsmF family)
MAALLWGAKKESIKNIQPRSPIGLSFRLSPGSPFNYYCLDAASLLPVIMLDINFGDSVLDMCAGKKWTMF